MSQLQAGGMGDLLSSMGGMGGLGAAMGGGNPTQPKPKGKKKK